MKKKIINVLSGGAAVINDLCFQIDAEAQGTSEVTTVNGCKRAQSLTCGEGGTAELPGGFSVVLWVF